MSVRISINDCRSYKGGSSDYSCHYSEKAANIACVIFGVLLPPPVTKPHESSLAKRSIPVGQNRDIGGCTIPCSSAGAPFLTTYDQPIAAQVHAWQLATRNIDSTIAAVRSWVGLRGRSALQVLGSAAAALDRLPRGAEQAASR